MNDLGNTAECLLQQMKQQCFPKSSRLKKDDFAHLFSRKKVFVGKVLLIQWRKTVLGRTRLGITVNKKFGNACTRNWFKRCVREVFRRQCPKRGIDINVLPRAERIVQNFSYIAEDMIAFLRSSSDTNIH